MLVNRSKVKEIVGSIQMTKGFVEELDKHVEGVIKKACKRAAANNRRTVMIRDI